MQSLSEKEYKNEFVAAFDGDDSGNTKPRQTPGVLYSKAIPTPVAKPELLAWSEELAQELGIEKPAGQKDVDILGGNHVAPSMYPYAACYAGHQFGNWAGQLGDGRAIILGEWLAPDGKSWEFQLKGAGLTPYSRRADGRAVLRSSVREYLMSEAMHYLGVPTTRALSLVSTGDQVMRDMFYNGNPAFEPGAIVMRVAPSFLRFGSFEMPAARRENENLQKLVDWTISRYYPHIQGENRILDWFKEVVERTANLMVDWMRVGFVHGVMNTDNMSILGLTIDYGPFSFLDDYDPDFTPNTTDLPGRRYAFGKQASIAYWNLGCLASAIAPLLPGTEELVAVLETYSDYFHEKYYAMMANKLGLDEVKEGDQELITRFTQTLYTLNLDMTIFFQQLMELPQELGSEEETVAHFQDSLYRDLEKGERAELHTLLQDYVTRLKANAGSREEAVQRMQKSNPRIILRNYLLHQAIEQLEKGENTLFLKLQAAMRDPYSRNHEEFFAKRPDWASQKAGCSMLSCSS
ncbi:protein adenylyltransferase SelO [Rufibacter latericius]|uniref:Protein nucleotidyltransferase YdiU n=1 Tax=Rufibacter latericius TaxID=2487040 RepID=A0A3M9MKV7_9BACT|nr:YdiU family protein [Rufibacter latericius]RNI26156.1 YdiU family protein [Rufibacter latericius]